MATYNLRRFTNAEALKAVAHERLVALLSPYATYLNHRELTLPSPSASDGLDYEQLVHILMNPGHDTPKGLIDALYLVHEMATPECMDVLLQEAEGNSITLDDNPDPTPADVAVQVYLQDKDLLERKHAEQQLTRPRSFEYFQTDVHPIPAFKPPSPKTMAALEKDLDDWFEKKKRGRGCRVFIYPKEDAVWFLVRHGDPFKREGNFAGQEPSVFYRPEKYDVLVYEPSIGEIRMNACSKGEKDLYRLKFGLHLFGNDNFFPGTAKYTLEPLRRDGEASLRCTDVDGMDWVKLIEVHYFWGGTEKEVEVRKANDVFAALNARGRGMPAKARILRASFQIKFSDSKRTRAVTIRASNIAQYTRDSDSAVVEEWLGKRTFILAEREEEHERVEEAVAGS